jgi:8-oxo-dGTP pyrophosphatase MutT (NUDIX family)
MTSPEHGLRIREAVRALVVDPHDRVLLVRFEFPRSGTRWALPGGGIEPGESDLDALRRELDEELGLEAVEIGPHIWNRMHIVPFENGQWDGQRERVYLVRTDHFEPRPRLSWEQLRAEFLHEIRWWHRNDIASTTHFVPAALPVHLAALLDDGTPNEPIDVGV